MQIKCPANPLYLYCVSYNPYFFCSPQSVPVANRISASESFQYEGHRCVTLADGWPNVWWMNKLNPSPFGRGYWSNGRQKVAGCNTFPTPGSPKSEIGRGLGVERTGNWSQYPATGSRVWGQSEKYRATGESPTAREERERTNDVTAHCSESAGWSRDLVGGANVRAYCVCRLRSAARWWGRAGMTNRENFPRFRHRNPEGSHDTTFNPQTSPISGRRLPFEVSTDKKPCSAVSLIRCSSWRSPLWSPPRG